MAAMAVMAATFVTSVFLGLSGIIRVTQAAVLGGAATFILTRPEGPSAG